MRKAMQHILILVIIALLIVAFDVTYMNVFLGRLIPTGNRVIVIDAGHGGRDGGAIGKNGTVEKNINLEIAKKLKGYIEANGDTCVMIREIDEGLYSEYKTGETKKSQDLKKRKEIIREYNADALVSIHLNSFPQAQYYGAQVFFPKGDNESEIMARYTQEELVKVLNRNNRRVEKSTDNYYIILNNNIPSILVECGFLSNPDEEKLLNSDEYQNKIAWAIYCGVMRYFTSLKD